MTERLPRRHRALLAMGLVLVTAVAASALGAVGASAAGPTSGAPPAARPALHVDCQAPAGGDGSTRRPFGSLAEASNVVLGPGQKLLFRRGTVCSGTLEVHGSGTSDRPAIVGAYGSGSMPQINGTSTDAVLVQNASYVTLRQLEITDRSAASTLPRRGVHVVADGVLVQGVRLERLYIHDVDGDLTKDTGGSGAVQLDAVGTSPNGRFADITVTGNQIADVSRSGIFIAGTEVGGRPAAADDWPAGSTGIVVTDNRLARLAGDGIVATGTVGAVIEGNTVSDGNRAGTPYTDPDAVCDAGIWAWNANSTVIEDNVVSGMEFNGCDGEGYDVDYNQDGTVVQDNLSEDNAGGFVLLCTDQETHHADVRYNLSIDDAASVEEAPCAIGSGNVGTLDGIRMFNNTIVAPHPALDLELVPLGSMFEPGDFEFLDNIVDATTPQSNALPCGSDCRNNLFSGLPPSGTDAVTANPQFTGPTASGSTRIAVGKGFRIARRSPAIAAGVAVADGASDDYFGHPLPSGAPSIGFDQHR